MSTGCSVIAFEDLTDIRERTGASWGHKWAFNRLYEYVEYKAEEYGITVEQVSPENTSRRCSQCGFTHPNNRDGEEFECLKCGYENHADYNAAKNIGLRYPRRTQTGSGGGAPVGVALNSGMLNANGAYEPPADESARAGVHAESQRLSRWLAYGAYVLCLFGARLTSSSVFKRMNPTAPHRWVGSFRCAVPPTPDTMRIRVGVTD